VRPLFVLTLAFAACAGPAELVQPVRLGTLAPDVSPAAEKGGVLMDVAPVTHGNWREYSNLVHTLRLSTGASGAGVQAGSNLGISTSGGGTLLVYEVSRLPLPCVLLRIQNTSDQPMRISAADLVLRDGVGRTLRGSTDAEEVRAQVERATAQRYPGLLEQQNREVLVAFRSSLEQVPLLAAETTIEPGKSLATFVAFGGEGAKLPPRAGIPGPVEISVKGIDFRFERARKKRRIICPNGVEVSNADHCPKDEPASHPIDGGPCIQRHKIPYSFGRYQWWVGDTAVANSDILRTLEAHPASRPPARTGFHSSVAGYVLIAVGILGAAATAVALARTVSPEKSPYGATVLSLAGAGVGVLTWSSTQTQKAIVRFNRDADADESLCAPVW
jgi:hypothetical protein